MEQIQKLYDLITVDLENVSGIHHRRDKAYTLSGVDGALQQQRKFSFLTVAQIEYQIGQIRPVILIEED